MSETGEVYEKAIKATTEEEATSFFRRLVERSMRAGKTREEAVAIVKENLGYFAAAYGNDARERVERLYKCEHPVFGPIAEMGPPTPEEAFECGTRWATGKQPKNLLAQIRKEKAH